MAGYFKYIKVYRSNIVDNETKIICDPVTIAVLDEEFRLSIIVPENNVFEVDTGGSIAKQVDITFPEGKYLCLTARTKEKNPYVAKKYCLEELNRVITLIALIYTPDIFSTLVYDGWIVEGDNGHFETWVKRTNKVNISAKRIVDAVDNVRFKIKSDNERGRFLLMSSFLEKAMPLAPSPEKFLLLWTALEIFPMMSQAKYRLISNYLSKVLSRDPAEIADNLHINRLYSLRSKFVHSGKFEVEQSELTDILDKLERIVTTVMRAIMEEEYDGRLDEYFPD